MYLTDFVIERPPFIVSQEEFFKLLTKIHPAAKENIARVCCKEDKISKRYTSIPSFENLGDFGDRAQFFQKFCEQVFDTFYPPNSLAPNDLIHVTCTGYRSPSAAQVLVSKQGWTGKTTVTHAYHMGCLAALSAIRIGRGFVSLGQKEVDIVHTELCTLHFHPSLNSDEQLVALSLFGDGLIKYTLRPKAKGPAFRILAQYEEMIAETEEVMKWECESWGLKMTLSKEIPKLIYKSIAPFVHRLVGEHSFENTYFAIHPGGPKIVELIGRKLKLSKEQLSATEKILYNCGNMSSATLPHIWEEILHNANYPYGSLIVGIAFGPGLTMSGILLEKVN